MSASYLSVENVRDLAGLRMVVVQGFPSPWSLSAKAMMEYKGLAFACAPQIPGGENNSLEGWSGTNSAPVVAWNDEKPINRWDDILHLIERIASETPLLPQDPESRSEVLGLAHELCGELGLGWNLRLTMFSAMAASGQMPKQIEAQTRKYGYRKDDVEQAGDRVRATLQFFSRHFEAQRKRRRHFLVGDSLTAADFYWAAFSSLVDIPGEDVISIPPQARALLESMRPIFSKHLDPQLTAHRDRIFDEHCRLPMEF